MTSHKIPYQAGIRISAEEPSAQAEAESQTQTNRLDRKVPYQTGAK